MNPLERAPDDDVSASVGPLVASTRELVNAELTSSQKEETITELKQALHAQEKRHAAELKWSAADAEWSMAISRLERVKKLERQLIDADKKAQTQALALQTSESSLVSAQHRVQELQSQVTSHQRQIRQAEITLTQHETVYKKLTDAQDLLQGRVEDYESALASRASEVDRLKELLDSVNTDLRAAKKEATKAQKDQKISSELKENIKSLNRDLQKKDGELQSLKKKHAGLKLLVDAKLAKDKAAVATVSSDEAEEEAEAIVILPEPQDDNDIDSEEISDPEDRVPMIESAKAAGIQRALQKGNDPLPTGKHTRSRKAATVTELIANQTQAKAAKNLEKSQKKQKDVEKASALAVRSSFPPDEATNLPHLASSSTEPPVASTSKVAIPMKISPESEPAPTSGSEQEAVKQSMLKKKRKADQSMSRTTKLASKRGRRASPKTLPSDLHMDDADVSVEIEAVELLPSKTKRPTKPSKTRAPSKPLNSKGPVSGVNVEDTPDTDYDEPPSAVKMLEPAQQPKKPSKSAAIKPVRASTPEKKKAVLNLKASMKQSKPVGGKKLKAAERGKGHPDEAGTQLVKPQSEVLTVRNSNANELDPMSEDSGAETDTISTKLPSKERQTAGASHKDLESASLATQNGIESTASTNNIINSPVSREPEEEDFTTFFARPLKASTSVVKAPSQAQVKAKADNVEASKATQTGPDEAATAQRTQTKSKKRKSDQSGDEETVPENSQPKKKNKVKLNQSSRFAVWGANADPGLFGLPAMLSPVKK